MIAFGEVIYLAINLISQASIKIGRLEAKGIDLYHSTFLLHCKLFCPFHQFFAKALPPDAFIDPKKLNEKALHFGRSRDATKDVSIFVGDSKAKRFLDEGHIFF